MSKLLLETDNKNTGDDDDNNDDDDDDNACPSTHLEKSVMYLCTDSNAR